MQKKQTTQNTAKRNYPALVTSYDTQPGNEIGLFYYVPEPTWGCHWWQQQCVCAWVAIDKGHYSMCLCCIYILCSQKHMYVVSFISPWLLC